MKTKILSFASVLFLLLLKVSAPAQVYILNEDFGTATGTTPPSGWTNAKITGQTTDLWHFNNPGARSAAYPITTPFAIFDAANYSSGGGNEISQLTSPAFNASIGTYCLVFLDTYFSGGAGATGKIQAFNGSTWVDVKSYTSASPTNPQHEILDLTGICTGVVNAKIRFQWEGNGQGYWMVDNIHIYAPLALDAGIYSVDGPVVPFPAGLQTVAVTLSNYGYQTLTSATIKWSVNGVLQPPFNWTGNIPYGSSLSNIPIGTYPFTTSQTCLIKTWSDSPNGSPDPYHLNDTTTKTISTGLCGTYTIGGANPDFPSISAVVAYLNTGGVSCPVIFKLRNGTFNEQMVLNDIQGSSAVNTMTFESESGDSTKVTIAGQSTPGIDFSAVHYLTCKKIRLTGGVQIENNSSHIKITNCIISGGAGNNATLGVLSGSHHIEILNNELNPGAFIGVTINSPSHHVKFGNNLIKAYSRTVIGTSGCINQLQINNNQIGHPGYAGFSAISVCGDTAFITGNKLVNVSGAISVSGNGPIQITGNRIDSAMTGGISISSAKTTLFNNYITIRTGSTFGIASSATNSTIAFNNINVTSESGTGRAFELNGGSNTSIVNNIFSNKGGGYAVNIIGSVPATINLDYNDYYSREDKIGFYLNQTYSTFTSWRTAINREAHGVNVPPFYTYEDNLIPNHISLNNTAIPVPGVTMDIDSVVRNATQPDIGAKEIDPCLYDAGLDKITSPSFPLLPGVQSVKVILRNQGASPLNSVTINWKVYNMTQAPFSWSGTLLPGESAEVEVGSLNFVSTQLCQVQAWTSNPNGQPDCNGNNNMVTSPVFYPKLCGTYTIGGANADFGSFTEATYFLMNGGVSCPVVFNVRDSIYPDTEIFQLGPVAGTSAVNTITFQSESGDSSKVYLVTGSSLTNVSYVTIKGIHLAGYTKVTGCDHINLKNCWVDHTHLVLKISGSQYISVRNCNIDLNLCNRYQALEFDATHGEIVGCEIFGGISGGGKDILIQDNKLENIIMNGDSITINRNKITLSQIIGCGGPYGTGIVANGKYLKIMNNKITVPATDVEKNGMSLTLVNSQVWNNDIMSSGDHPVNGIVVTSATNSSISFNNINVIPFYAETRALVITTSNNLTIRNNVFSHQGGGYPLYLGAGVNVASLSMDYNDYFSTSNKIGAVNDTIFSTLSSWSQRIGGEMHGKTVNPYFTSKTNLTPNHVLLNNAAQPIVGIEYDIDSVARNPVTPDIGSREFGICSNDAGIDRITSPTILFTPGSLTVKVILQNQGSQPLTSATIRLSFNGILQAPFNWTGNLLSGESAEVVAGTFPFNATLYRIKAWTLLPNNATDCNHNNDTCARQSFYPLLCGTYTIGGTNPNFLNFSDAAETLNNTIISCPVKFKVRNGTYTERFALYKVTGISAQNPVSFESESGNNSSVILTYPTGNQTLFQTIGLYNVSYVKIQGITIKANYPPTMNYPYRAACILLADGVYDSVVNCRLLPDQNAYGIHSRFGSKIFVGSNYCKGILRFNGTRYSLVKNNILVDGGIDCGWDNGNTHSQNKMEFRENEFHRSAFSYTGAAQNDTILVEKNTIHDVAVGINVSSNGGTVVASIFKNRVFNISGTGISISTNIYNMKCSLINNYVHTKPSSSAGISMTKASNSVLEFNSVNCQSSSLQGKALTITSSSNLFAKNNIFSNSGSGTCCFLDVVPPGTIFDYNDYYNPSNRLGLVNGTVYQSLSAWGAAINGEANGKTLYPYFAHDTSFHIYQRNLNGAAIPLAGVTTDLEDDVRNASAPDVGADEFKVDFGVSEVISPSLVCIHTPGEHVVIKLKQFGDIPFLNQQVAFSLNNGTPVIETIQGWMFHDSVFTFSQPVDISFQGTYSIKAWLVNNWDDDVSNDTITVMRYTYPAPAGDFIYMKNCVDEAVVFQGTATISPPYAIASYQWTFGDGTTGTGQEVSHHYNSSGTYLVTLLIYSNMGCYSKYTKSITLLPEPVAHFTVSTGNCQGASVFFDDSSNTPAGILVKWKWNFGDGTSATVLAPANPDISHNYANYGTYQVVLTVYSADSCSASYTASTTVGVAPVAGFTTSLPACLGNPVNFTDNSNPNSGTAITSWNWNFGDPASGGSNSSLLQNPSHLFTSPGVYTVTLDVSNGTCSSSISHDVTVGAIPVPALSGALSVCAGTTGLIYTTQPGMVNYQWQISAGGTITAGGSAANNTAMVTWTNPGTQWIKVSYANQAGCSASSPAQLDVAVHPLPAPTIIGPVIVCAPEGNYVYSTEPGKNGYLWTVTANGSITFGAGTDQIVVSWNTIGTGTVSVNYQNSDGCLASIPAHLVVDATQKPPTPTITGPTLLCSNTTATFTTEPGYPYYTWTTTGTIISGGATSDNWVSISFATAGAASVNVSYNTAAGCNSGWSNHSVTVNPRPAPTISGPSDVCSGVSGNTYTTEAGMSGYTWLVAPGGTITSGGTATSNSVTITWNTTGLQWVRVNYNNGFGCSAAAAVNFNVTVNPVPVPTLTGTSSLCAGSSGILYATEPGMNNYSWNISSGGFITGGGTSSSNSATVTWNLGGSQWISVNYSNGFGCSASAPVSQGVTVNAVPVPTITGPNTTCVVSTGNLYVTEPGMSNYQWSVSAGGAITAGTGTNSISVTWSGTGTQTVTVNYTNPAGCSAATPAIFNVSVGNMPAPTITGSTSLCVNSGYYTYTTEAGMTGYTWSISPGGSIISGLGTPELLVTWNSPGSQWVKVNYTNPGGCTGLVPTQLNVSVNPLPGAAGIITGLATLCPGTTGVVYQVAPVSNAVVYVWSLPPGATIVSGAGTNIITVDFNSTAQSGEITVAGNNLCGNGIVSPAFPLIIKPLPSPPGSINGFDHVCKPIDNLVYTIVPVTGADSYLWSVPPGAVIVAGSTTNTITVNYPDNAYSGSVVVHGINACGNGPESSLQVVVAPVPPVPSIVQNADTLTSSATLGNQWYRNDTIIMGANTQKYIPVKSGDYFVRVNLNNCYSDSSGHIYFLMTMVGKIIGTHFVVYPVPNDGRFTITISSNTKRTFSLTIYDELGRIIWENAGLETMGKTEKEIDLGPVPAGLYSLILRNSEGSIFRKIIVNR